MKANCNLITFLNTDPHTFEILFQAFCVDWSQRKCTAAEFDNFDNEIHHTHSNLSLKQAKFCLLYELNIDRIYKNNNIRKYANILLSCSVKGVVDEATRVTAPSKTLLAHICTCLEQNVKGGVVSDISDHFSTFVTMPDKT